MYIEPSRFLPYLSVVARERLLTVEIPLLPWSRPTTNCDCSLTVANRRLPTEHSITVNCWWPSTAQLFLVSDPVGTYDQILVHSKIIYVWKLNLLFDGKRDFSFWIGFIFVAQELPALTERPGKGIHNLWTPQWIIFIYVIQVTSVWRIFWKHLSLFSPETQQPVHLTQGIKDENLQSSMLSGVLCSYETLSLNLRGRNKLQVWGIRALRKTYEPKNAELNEHFRIIYNVIIHECKGWKILLQQ